MNTQDKALNEAAEKYFKETYPIYIGKPFPQADFYAGATSDAAKQYWQEQLQTEQGIIISKGNEVNCLLIGALRFLNDEQRIALRNALIERTPKLNNKQVGADVLEKSMNAVSQLSNEDIADAYNQVKDIQFEGMTVDEYFSQPISFSEDEIKNIADIELDEIYNEFSHDYDMNIAAACFIKGFKAALQQKSVHNNSTK